jgi:hypothetical protein
MVPDVLFTFITLFRMPQGETRQRCCREVLSKMRESPEEFLPERLRDNRSMGMGMPLKMVVEDVIKETATTNKMNYRGGASTYKRVEYQQRLGKPSPTFQAVQQSRQQVPDGVAVAHSATVNQEAKFLSKGEKVQSFVERGENIWVKSGAGKDFPYTATEVPCQRCMSGPPDQRHFALCTLTRCFKCGCYGHKEFECRQEKRIEA